MAEHSTSHAREQQLPVDVVSHDRLPADALGDDVVRRAGSVDSLRAWHCSIVQARGGLREMAGLAVWEKSHFGVRHCV